MNTSDQTLQGVLIALVIAVISSLTTLGIPAFWKWVNGKLEASQKREQNEIEDTKEDDTLERETRQLQYKLAVTALDKSEQLSRLQDEYREQGDLVARQAMEIERLKPFEDEAKRGRIKIDNLQAKLDYCRDQYPDMGYLLDDTTTLLDEKRENDHD